VVAATGLEHIRFGEPVYLWLLLVPLLLLPAWLRLARLWRRDARRLRQQRLFPIRERYTFLGAWPFWLCLLGALIFTILAAARPRSSIPRLRTAGVDLVVLQDGSASMHVRDVAPDRWQRSMRFLRVLSESLQWKNDRFALALFARIAAPQVRLTRDPNTVFFFLDHLDRESPFPLQDVTTWDTNIELGINWGTKLIGKDAELNGRSPNSQAFVLISDGQAWNGEVDTAMAAARAHDIPLYAVGVGTIGGGDIPDPPDEPDGSALTERPDPIHSVLDRTSLMALAANGRGAYFDLGADSDRHTANAIIDAVRRRAGPQGVEQTDEELYWYCLLSAATLMSAGVLFLRTPAELWLQVAGLTTGLVTLWYLLG
jgi:hypothetical protein